MEADTSKPLTVSPALGSAGPLQTAAGSSAQAGQGPTQQDAILEGRWLLLPPAPTPPTKVTLAPLQVL